MTVRNPFSTRMQRCLRAKSRAAPTRFAWISATLLPGQPRHLAGMRRENQRTRAALQRLLATPAYGVQPVGIQHHRAMRTLAPCDARTPPLPAAAISPGPMASTSRDFASSRQCAASPGTAHSRCVFAQRLRHQLRRKSCNGGQHGRRALPPLPVRRRCAEPPCRTWRRLRSCQASLRRRARVQSGPCCCPTPAARTVRKLPAESPRRDSARRQSRLPACRSARRRSGRASAERTCERAWER